MASFWKPPNPQTFIQPTGLNLVIDQPSGSGSGNAEENVNLVYNRHKHLSLQQQRKLLPIHSYKNKILYALEKYRTLVLIGGNNNCHSNFCDFILLSST